MKDLSEKCDYKKEINKIKLKKLDNNFLKHLKEDPIYQCYFCDGFNYNCEYYKCVVS